ncbi:MAG: NF038122 family metalloprotease [Luteolibacter sp.]
MKPTTCAKWTTLLTVSCLSFQAAVGQGAISWDASYFNDVGLSASEFATFQDEINIALNYYSSNWQAPHAVTVKVDFRAVDFGLGTASTYGADIAYQDYYNALSSTGTSADDATALSFIPNSPNNPANGNLLINMSTPLLRAMGFNYSPGGGDADATISLNTNLMALNRSGPVDPAKYDLRQVTYHELNEVLGFRSGLNGVANAPGPGPTGPIGPADLFRYDGVGSRSWSTDINELQPYFSIDNGVTKLAEFDIDDAGDRQDFDGMIDGFPAPSVQDAFSTPGIRLDQGVAEETFLDVIGYNRVVVPEPSTSALLALGGLVLLRRRRPNC